MIRNSFEKAEIRIAHRAQIAVHVGDNFGVLLKPMVLVVGSNSMDTMLMEMVLSENGMQIQVISADDAEHFEPATTIDAIVIDCEDCGRDTVALIGRLRGHRRCLNASVIITTSAAPAGRDSSMLSARVRWVLKKPIAAASFPKLVLKTICESKVMGSAMMGSTAFTERRIPTLDMGQSVSSAGMASVR